MCQFGVAKRKWLATFLGLPGGVPSHDTSGRVFARPDPDATIVGGSTGRPGPDGDHRVLCLVLTARCESPATTRP